ncbi:MAG: HRDC domain-containing protein, partial [Duncaniella sp.]|nr:HRDC domain-containing protein [Duncaniella sp.]
IDKSNIRWVIHNNMTGNIESYYQEIGRAGRDGVKAEAIMFYSYADVVTRQSFVDESGQQSINNEKLMRMKEFAESSVCRRRVLLSYFNETVAHDCGNCDVCLNPPERFDGTIIAQKALSAIIRTEGGAGFSMLNDILRGMARSDISAKGFDRIKTYGAGRDLSRAEWNHYLSQLIQLGLIDIAYNDNNHLKITPYGATVLRDRSSVTLARYIPEESASHAARKKKAAKAEEVLSPAERLLAELKDVRLKLARKESLPPYLVFSDKTLLEMVRIEPLDMEAFSTVEGVGEKKTVKYWKPFVMAIRRFKGITEKLGTGMSAEETLLLINAGYTLQQIAEVKGIKFTTVCSHVAQLIREDRLTDFSSIITRDQYMRVMDLCIENISLATRQ